MTNIICYICKDNLCFKSYEGSKLLDSDGNKPCFDCLMEAGVFDDNEEENGDSYEREN